MPSPNQKQVQKDYRARQRALLGDTAYKALEAQKRKARRLAATQRPLVIPPRQQPEQVEEQKQPEQVIEQPSTDPVGIAEIREVIKILNTFLNQTYHLDLKTVSKLVKAKAIPSMIKLRENQNCETLFEAVYAARSKLVSESNKSKPLDKNQFKRLQWNSMTKIYKDMFNSAEYNCKDIDWLKETDKVIHFIKTKYTNANTQITKLSNLAAITSVLNGFEDAYKTYSKLSTSDRSVKQKTDDKNLITDKEKPNILHWNELKNIYRDNKLSLKTRALIGLYTTTPPRRAELGGLLTIRYDDKNLDPDFNFLIIDPKTKMPEKIVMMKYKTFKKYGKYEIELNNKAYNNILKRYIKERKLEEGDPVFGKVNGQYYKNFSDVLLDQFKTATKKSISVNLLRHAFISDFLSKPRSIAEKKEVAKQLGHTISTMEKYFRIDLKDIDTIDD